MVTASRSRTLYCSFCRKDHHRVDKLVAGPGVYICDVCTELSRRAMDGKPIPDFPGWASLSDDELLGSLPAAIEVVRAVERSVGDQVRLLRSRGVTWARIGEAMGMSRQAAWERFSGEE